jgi:hypothetical protein
MKERVMQELSVVFAPSSGHAPRVITLRIGTPVRGERSWSAVIEILGFDWPYSATCQGEDWAQVLELSAMLLPFALQGMVAEAGGGTLDPPFYEREAPDLSKYPDDIRALLGIP